MGARRARPPTPPTPGPSPHSVPFQLPGCPGGGRLRGGRPGAAAPPCLRVRDQPSEGPLCPGAPRGAAERGKSLRSVAPPGGPGRDRCRAGRAGRGRGGGAPPPGAPAARGSLEVLSGGGGGGGGGRRRRPAPTPSLLLPQRALSTLRGEPLRGPPGAAGGPPPRPPHTAFFIYSGRAPLRDPGAEPPGRIPEIKP